KDFSLSNTFHRICQYRKSDKGISYHVPNNPYPIGKPRLRKPIIHCDTYKQQRKGNNGGKKHLENIVSTSRMRMVVSVIIVVVVIVSIIFVMPFYQFLSTCFGVDFFFLCATKLFAL